MPTTISRALGSIAVLLLAGSPAWAAPADDLYATASRQYEDRQWLAAAEAFVRFAEENPGHERAPAAIFYSGESFVQVGNHDGAVRQFRTLLEKAPEHRHAKTARFRIGESLLLTGKPAEAAEALVEFRKIHPGDDLNAFVLVYLGDIARDGGQLAEGQGRYELALREFPQGPLALAARFGMARCSQLGGQFDAAIAAYGQVVAHDHPLADDARLQIGLIHYQQGRYVPAEGALTLVNSSKSAARLHPQSLYWLGLTQLAAQRPADAARSLQAAAEAAGETAGAAAVYCALADALRQAGDLPGADSAYRLVVERWPQNEWADDALYGRLVIAEEQNEADRAEALAREILHRYPDGPLAAATRITHARVLLNRKDYVQAEKLLADAIEAARGSMTADAAQVDGLRYCLALCQVGQGKHTEALATIDTISPTTQHVTGPVRETRIAALVGLKQFNKALPLLREHFPTTTDPQAQARLRGQIVMVLVALKEFPEASDEIKLLPPESLADGPVSGAALAVAEHAYQSEDLNAARRLFETLSQPAVPANIRSQALSGLAWVQFRAEGKQASAATFEKLLREYPDSIFAAEAALVRGRSLEDLAQHDAALAAYKVVVERYGKSAQAQAALLATGRLHAKLRQLREAEAALQNLLTNYPHFSQADLAWYELAWVLESQSKHAAADGAFARLSQDYPQSKYWADATYRLADRAAKAKDREKATALAQALINSQCEGEIRQNALYLRGQLAAAAGQWDDVASNMNQLAQQYPQSPSRLSAEFWSAEADFRRGEFQSAAEKLDRVAGQSSGKDEPWLAMVPFRKAQCLALEKRWAEALALAETVRSNYPQFKQQHDVDYLIGRCLGSLGRLDEARAAYERAAAAPTAVGTETAAMAQWMVGETLFHQKRYEEAAGAYERGGGQHVYPKWQAASLLQAGKCRLLLGQNAQAQAHFAKVAGDLKSTPYAAEAAEQLAALPGAATVRPATLRSE